MIVAILRFIWYTLLSTKTSFSSFPENISPKYQPRHSDKSYSYKKKHVYGYSQYFERLNQRNDYVCSKCSIDVILLFICSPFDVDGRKSSRAIKPPSCTDMKDYEILEDFSSFKSDFSKPESKYIFCLKNKWISKVVKHFLIKNDLSFGS